MRSPTKRPGSERQHEITDEIVGRLVGRHSIATVLFHHAVAERLGLGPTDLKCLDLLRERGTITGSDLAAITDLTTGAITGVVARLERAGYLRREPDPNDGRQQILHPALDRMRDLHHVFDPIRKDVAALLESFDRHQLTALAEFLARSTDVIYHHIGLLRAQTFGASRQPTGTAHSPDHAGTRVPLTPSRKLRRKRN
jgi:DNA-binding MarR family transcriptional regulator